MGKRREEEQISSFAKLQSLQKLIQYLQNGGHHTLSGQLCNIFLTFPIAFTPQLKSCCVFSISLSFNKLISWQFLEISQFQNLFL